MHIEYHEMHVVITGLDEDQLPRQALPREIHRPQGPIQQLIWDLNTDSQVLAAWLNDPMPLARERGIDPCCAAILASGDANAIQALVDYEGSFPIRTEVIIKII
jgi:hypothetical protein